MARFCLTTLLVFLLASYCLAESSGISPHTSQQKQPFKYCGTTQWKPFFEAIQEFCKTNEPFNVERNIDCQKLLSIFSYCRTSMKPQKHERSLFPPLSRKTIATFRKLGFFVLKFHMDDHQLWSITFSLFPLKNNSHQFPMRALNWTVLGMSKEKK